MHPYTKKKPDLHLRQSHNNPGEAEVRTVSRTLGLTKRGERCVK